MDFEKQPTITAYDVLGIDADADQKQIHAALRVLALAWHPDRVPDARRGEATLHFQAILDAYEKIRTPAARAAYNASIRGILRAHKSARAARMRGAAAPDAANTNKAPGESDSVLPFAVRAKAWLRAIETVFWPVRKTR